MYMVPYIIYIYYCNMHYVCYNNICILYTVLYTYIILYIIYMYYNPSETLPRVSFAREAATTAVAFPFVTSGVGGHKRRIRVIDVCGRIYNTVYNIHIYYKICVYYMQYYIHMCYNIYIYVYYIQY